MRFAPPARPASMSSIAILFAMIIAILAAGCRSASSSDEDNATAPATVMMAVSGAKVAVMPMRSEVRLLGQTAAMRHVSLRAPSAGRVIGLNLQTGDWVTRGEIVAHILSREVEAAQQGLAVARQIDPSEAPSLARSIKPYTSGTGIAVRTPETAIVAQRLVSSGQMVADLDPLVDLIDPRSIYIDAAIPVDNLDVIRPGMEAIVTSPLHPGVEFPARVAAISPAFSQAGATSPARIEFTGTQRINEAGAPVEVRVTTRYVPDAIAVPTIALFENAANDSFYVFVADANGRARRTAVTTGIRTPPYVQITSGLEPGQIVITSGGYALSDGLKVIVTIAQR